MCMSSRKEIVVGERSEGLYRLKIQLLLSTMPVALHNQADTGMYQHRIDRYYAVDK